jgi:hypothetical protein
MYHIFLLILVIFFTKELVLLNDDTIIHITFLSLLIFLMTSGALINIFNSSKILEKNTLQQTIEIDNEHLIKSLKALEIQRDLTILLQVPRKELTSIDELEYLKQQVSLAELEIEKELDVELEKQQQDLLNKLKNPLAKHKQFFV